MAALVCSLELLALSPSAASSTGDEPPFDITISSPATTFTVGSPVEIDETIVSHSDQILWFTNIAYRPVTPGAIVRDDQGNALEPIGAWRGQPGSIPCNIGGGVDPFKKLHERLNLATVFDLSRPGRYSVQLARRCRNFRDTREVSISNILEIKILDRKSE
jgi:hypothetical protein